MQQFCGFLNVCVCMRVCVWGGGRRVKGVKYSNQTRGKTFASGERVNPKIIAAVEKRCSVH